MGVPLPYLVLLTHVAGGAVLSPCCPGVKSTPVPVFLLSVFHSNALPSRERGSSGSACPLADEETEARSASVVHPWAHRPLTAEAGL